MKKVWLVVALSAVCGLAASTFADVQNIRLSGDIRLRGYYLANAAEGSFDTDQSSTAFIAQRTRVCVEADLEDHVLVVVTLKAEGLWGADNETSQTAGAGSEDDAGGPINRGWAVGISEAYLQLNEVFYTPATLKLGRQYLNYGRGLILSSVDQEYNYDAGRLVLDYYPVTLDIVGARLADFGGFGGDHGHPSANLVFANARYEMTDSPLKDIEVYAGWVSQSANAISATRVPPTFAGSSPIIIGARGDLNVADGLNLFAEGAYEMGANGTVAAGQISAFLAQGGFKFVMKDNHLTPTFNGTYTYAGGGGGNGRHNFVPWFDYQDGYNGYLFAPLLSNIQIFNLGASIKPWENTTLAVQGYYYMKVDGDTLAGSNPNIDFGGLEFTREGTDASKRELGWEIDGILGYDYSKDVRGQLVYGMFLPSRDYRLNGDSQVAHEVRAEVDVKF